LYIRLTNFKSSIMKLLLAIALLYISLGHANSLNDHDKTKGGKESLSKEKGEEEKTTRSIGIHSIKKWKITIVYTNNKILSKTVSVNKNSSKSALDNALDEADKYLRKNKKIKEYHISPVYNSNVLLAGD